MKTLSRRNQIAVGIITMLIVMIIGVSGCSEESTTEPPDPPDPPDPPRLSAPTFTNVSNSPALRNGLPGEWDRNGALYSSVIQDGDTLRMWYTGVNDNDVARIGYAWSLDGQNWNEYAGNPVMSASLSWELGDVGQCEVIKDNTTFKMWYGAGSIGDPRHRKMGYATSSDGINWTKHPDPVMETGAAGSWSDKAIAVGTVIKEDGTYKMWYNGNTGTFGTSNQAEIGYATSSDGISWSKLGRVVRRGDAGQWDAQRIWGAVVVKVSSDLLDNTNDRYEMVYCAAEAPVTTQWLGYASSEDGEVWVKKTNPIVNTPPGFGGNYYSSELLKFNGEYHLWFTSWGGGIGRIGYSKGTRE
jgi:hypothetical protein